MLCRNDLASSPAPAVREAGADSRVQRRTGDWQSTIVATLWDCPECRRTVRVFSKATGVACAMVSAECPSCGWHTMWSNLGQARNTGRQNRAVVSERTSTEPRAFQVTSASPFAA